MVYVVNLSDTQRPMWWGKEAVQTRAFACICGRERLKDWIEIEVRGRERERETLSEKAHSRNENSESQE